VHRIPRFTALCIVSLIALLLWPSLSWAQYPYYVDSSLRVVVTPRQAEVYVDGYYSGIVDDFDGFFQRLRLPPGEHEVTLYREGFRTVQQKVYLTPDSTYKLTYAMVKLPEGETAGPRPTAPPPSFNEPYPPQTASPGGSGAPRVPPAAPPRRPPPAPPAGYDPNAGAASGFGALVVRIQPANAEVLIDGERWRGPDGADERLIVQLAEGSHHVEVRKDGFRMFSTEIQIHGGETLPLNVSLSPDRE
jgi:PEGA domain